MSEKAELIKLAYKYSLGDKSVASRLMELRLKHPEVIIKTKF